ncbi:hypothetical protein PT974_11545 [Cladobotryum mycophilum]|uniref:Arrestin-like N-terminal domain-containing protein n=1 Tax=Cladobotryum mycophilum TaxID=491253 RepID=A0ABR0S5K1_9HYPO
MSIRISLDNQPEFYTNLDLVSGKILLTLNRTEQIGSIVVKLEGESVTALTVPRGYVYDPTNRETAPPGPPGSISSENHKILYKIQQVFPDDYYASSSNPYGAFPLPPGQHEFPFKFKMPINNACSDPVAMSKIGGVAGVGGYGSGGGLFGMGGVRVMDGTKQLYLRHVTSTLPPSLTGYPMEAEIRYYIKVTVQRPGFLKENWRFQVGFKFLPIEPPRPEISGQEAFARRPFTFRPRTPSQPQRKKSSFFSMGGDRNNGDSTNLGDSSLGTTEVAPSVEMSARLPHPATLTCNLPVPLRLIAKKLANSREQIYLVSFQMDLIGITEVRSHGMFNKKINRWVVASNAELMVPLGAPEDEVGKEIEIPDEIWKTRGLPNTVAPSFSTCNLTRRYELELKIGISWGKPKTGILSKDTFNPFQTIFLPLHFATVNVFSGITPPPELVAAARTVKPGRVTLTVPPRLPPRRGSHSAPPTPTAPSPSTQLPSQPPLPSRPAQDPLYPPQLQEGDVPPYDDAPPSYDEAIAENLSGPFDGLRPRPAYSGVTNENAPSQMPAEKS